MLGWDSEPVGVPGASSSGMAVKGLVYYLGAVRDHCPHTRALGEGIETGAGRGVREKRRELESLGVLPPPPGRLQG